MAITQCVPSSFKTEVMNGTHDLTNGGDSIFVALYLSSAVLDATTTAYTATGETSGTGYVAGGQAVTGNTDPAASGTTSYWTPSGLTLVWAASSFTARGAMVYNSTKANKVICILDFGADKTCSASDFTITWPTNDATSALIRAA